MAKPDSRIAGIRRDISQLRRNCAGALASASRAAYEGIGQLAENERTALHTHYAEARRNLKQLRRGGTPRDLVAQQLTHVQQAAGRIVANTRGHFAILNHTRRRIGAEIRHNLENSAQGAGGASQQTRGATATAFDTALKNAEETADEAQEYARNAALPAEDASPRSTSRPRTSGATRPRSTQTGMPPAQDNESGNTSRRNTTVGSATRSTAKKRTSRSTAAEKPASTASKQLDTGKSGSKARKNDDNAPGTKRPDSPADDSASSDSTGGGRSSR